MEVLWIVYLYSYNNEITRDSTINLLLISQPNPKYFLQNYKSRTNILVLQIRFLPIEIGLVYFYNIKFSQIVLLKF